MGAPQQQNSSMMAISDEEFNRLRDLIHKRFGINLTEQKRSLLVGRLQKLMRKLNLPTFASYYDYLSHDKTEASLSELVDLISTNHTYFNREKTILIIFHCCTSDCHRKVKA